MRRLILSVLAAALVWAAGPQRTVLASDLYWAEADQIRRANLDGSGVQGVLFGFPAGIALDTDSGRIYWTDNPPLGAPGPSSRVRGANLDGSGPEDLVTSLAWPQGIALEPPRATVTSARMYWGIRGN
jgi:hypothetical protein